MLIDCFTHSLWEVSRPERDILQRIYCHDAVFAKKIAVMLNKKTFTNWFGKRNYKLYNYIQYIYIYILYIIYKVNIYYKLIFESTRIKNMFRQKLSSMGTNNDKINLKEWFFKGWFFIRDCLYFFKWQYDFFFYTYHDSSNYFI